MLMGRLMLGGKQEMTEGYWEEMTGQEADLFSIRHMPAQRARSLHPPPDAHAHARVAARTRKATRARSSTRASRTIPVW